MRLPVVLTALGVIAAATLTACSPGGSTASDKAERIVRKREPLRVVTRLDCPERQNGLTRVEVAPDGRSCLYQAADAEVSLRLAAFERDDAEAALAPIETELKSLMPQLRPASAGGGTTDKSAARIHLPGLSIDARDEGADIRIGGMTIKADDGAAQVRVTKNVTERDGDRAAVVSASDAGDGNVDIRADDQGAVVRHRQKADDGVRATLVLASDKAPAGYHLAGYEARGPKGGPLVVAVVKAKRRDTDDGALFKAMKALVRHNVGG